MATILRDHATDWNGEQMPDLEPAKGDPTAGLMRAAADQIEKGDAMRHALSLALEYWSHRQQRYKNRHPAWVQAAKATMV